jgi:diguanylate cyclase (GGDEF)-like protein
LSTHTSIVTRHEQALSLCLCDLDNFKQVNDTYGNRMGDRVLETFAWIVSQKIRNEDCAGRMGGDEFILAFPR